MYYRVRMTFWVLLFFVTSFCFKFNVVYHPGGSTGNLNIINLIASILYLVAWFGLSVWAGTKGKKEVLIAAMIYSILPMVSLIVGLAIPVFILISFLWTWPIQGFFIISKSIGPIIALFQPLLFLLGFKKSTNIYKTIKM